MVLFAPSFTCARITFFTQMQKNNRIYYYSWRLFILIQYPSEWIFLIFVLVYQFFFCTRKKISASVWRHSCDSHNGDGEEEINPLNFVMHSYYIFFCRDCIKKISYTYGREGNGMGKKGFRRKSNITSKIESVFFFVENLLTNEVCVHDFSNIVAWMRRWLWEFCGLFYVLFHPRYKKN